MAKPSTTWSYNPAFELPPEEEEECPGSSHCLVDEQIACEWGLVFALLNWPHDRQWYDLAAREAFKHPDGSWSYAHWWGLRGLFGSFKGSLDEFQEYRTWKYEQIKDRRPIFSRKVEPRR